MVDESTTVSSKCALIVYIRIVFDIEVTNYFLDLVELENRSGKGIAECILKTLIENGLPVELLAKKFIGFASDGASALRGMYSGAATCLQVILGVPFVSFHCIAHRLELAVHCVVKSINSVSHFRILCDEFHNIYSHSSKRLFELNAVAQELSVQILKLGKVFDVHWLMSTYNAGNALWIDLAALQRHMNVLSRDSGAGIDRSKFSGLEKKLKSWLVVAEIALMRDVLSELRRFSLHRQHRDTSIINVGVHLEILIRALAAMKETCGSTLQFVIDSFNNSNDSDDEIVLPAKSNAIVKTSSKKEQMDFESFRKQFLQGPS